MSIVCARRDCGQASRPASPDGITRFVTVLCAAGGGHHQEGSSFVHADCAVSLAPGLIARVDFLPYCQEVAVAIKQGRQERLYERRADGYYFCGHVSCLVDLLKIYGSPQVKELLTKAEAGAKPGSLPRLGADADIQLRRALEEIEDRVRLARGDFSRRPSTRLGTVQRVGAPAVTAAPVAPQDLATLLARTEGRKSDSKTILLVGAGAVGSFLGARLLLAGHRVVVVDRQERSSAIRSEGLRLETRTRTEAAPPTAIFDSLEDAFPPRVNYDLMLLATKAYDVAGILNALPAAKFSLPRKVMLIQNGVGPEESAKRLLGASHVLAASLTIPLSVKAAGSVLVERDDCGLGIASLDPRESLDEWVMLFRRAKIRTLPFSDYRALKWSKLLLNLVANATCAILDRSPGEIYRQRTTFKLEHAMLKETLAVMDKLDIRPVDLPGAPARTLVKLLKYSPAWMAQRVLEPQIRDGRGDKMPSLHIDLAAGRKQSEVLFMNGAVAREGRRQGVPTPINFLLADTLHKIFQRVLLWEDFRDKPDALIARLNVS